MRSYNERRNREIWVLVQRRRWRYQDVPAEIERRGFGIVTYDNVRKIVSLLRKIHNNSQAISANSR